MKQFMKNFNIQHYFQIIIYQNFWNFNILNGIINFINSLNYFLFFHPIIFLFLRLFIKMNNH